MDKNNAIGWDRTSDLSVNSRALCLLSYESKLHSTLATNTLNPSQTHPATTYLLQYQLNNFMEKKDLIKL